VEDGTAEFDKKFNARHHKMKSDVAKGVLTFACMMAFPFLYGYT
jgi:hypothetical protein